MATLPPPWRGIATKSNGVVTIEFVADVACPYCHIGLKRLQRAVATVPMATIDVIYTPFILHDDSCREGVAKHERTLAQAAATAAEDGLALNLAGQRLCNSKDGHRLLLWSGARALELFEAMATEYNQEQGWLGDHDVLARAVARCELDVDGAREMLADASAFQAELDSGLMRAKMLGVSSVPSFFVNGSLLGSGALSQAAIRSVIEHVCGYSQQCS